MAGSFDPSKVTLIIGGLPVQGFADGEFINLAPAQEGDSIKAGVDDVVVVRDPRRHGTLTVRLEAASPLGSIAVATFLTWYNTGNVILPYSLASKDTGEGATGELVLMRPPVMSFGIESPVREFVFAVTNIVMQGVPVQGVSAIDRLLSALG